MKIQPNNSIKSSGATRRKQTGNSKFSSLLSSEMVVEDTHTSTTEQASSQQNTPPEQQRAAFQEATKLLDQALEQWESDGALSDATMSDIQKARQQLGNLAAQNPILAQAETVLAVESKRLQRLNH